MSTGASRGALNVNFTNEIFVIALLIASAVLFDLEISLARREGQAPLDGAAGQCRGRARACSEDTGPFLHVVQIGQNAIAILGGIVGSPRCRPRSRKSWARLRGPVLETASFIVSFVIVSRSSCCSPISCRSGSAWSRPSASRLPSSSRWASAWSCSHRWFGCSMASQTGCSVLKLPNVRTESVTSPKSSRWSTSARRTGALLKQERQLIVNVFELDARTVPSAMTNGKTSCTCVERERGEHPREARRRRTRSFRCARTRSTRVGYVDSKDIFARILWTEAVAARPIRSCAMRW